MVKIRLSRIGRKKRPYYRIIVVDSHKRRDSDFIEKVGYYHPLDDPATVLIEGEKALKWLRVGAQPTQTVLSLLKREGVWLRFTLEKSGMPEETINERMIEWMAKRSKNAVAPSPVKKVTAPVVPAVVVEPIVVPAVVAEPEVVAEPTVAPEAVAAPEVAETASDSEPVADQA